MRRENCFFIYIRKPVTEDNDEEDNKNHAHDLNLPVAGSQGRRPT